MTVTATRTGTRRKWDVAKIAEFRSKDNPETGRQYSLRWCQQYVLDTWGVRISIQGIRLALDEPAYRVLVSDENVTPHQLPWKLTEELSHDYIGYGCRAVATVERAESKGQAQSVDPKIANRAAVFREWLDRHGPDQVVQLDPSAHNGRGGWVVRPRNPKDERGWYGFMIP